MTMREISKLLPSYNVTIIDGEIMWKNWRKLKNDYHINGVSMRVLVREASSFLAQRSRKNEKKTSIEERKTWLYVNFIDRKKNKV